MNKPLIIGEVGTVPADTIIVELGKEDVIRLVCGSDIPLGGIPMVTKLTVNQRQEQWVWCRDSLRTLTIDELMQIYALINWSTPLVVEQPKIVIV